MLEPRHSFNLQLYRFARQQFADEVSRRFPRIRSIKSTQSLFIVDLFESLPADERLVLMEGLLLRAHRKTCALIGESLSEHHIEALKAFDERNLATGGAWKYIPLRSKRGYRKFFAGQARPLPPEAEDRDFEDGFAARFDRRLFLRDLEAQLASAWSRRSKCGKDEWQYAAFVRDTRATLNLDFGARSEQLGFWHDVDGVARFLSIGQWLGVGNISWNLCTVKDSVQAAIATAKLSNEFLTHMTSTEW